MAAISNVETYNALGLSRNEQVNTEVTKQDQFMKLMIAQLQNQDPLEPQENGEFLSQLAQFDTATGISELQDSFTSFANTMQSNSALQASTLVGHDVLIPASSSYLSDGGSINGSIDLTSSTGNLKVEVLDAAGQTIKTIGLGNKLAGDIAFKWDGINERGEVMPAGTYTFKASAQVGNETTAQEVLVSAKVDSVSIGKPGQGLKLNLLGMGQIDFASVREIQ